MRLKAVPGDSHIWAARRSHTVLHLRQRFFSFKALKFLKLRFQNPMGKKASIWLDTELLKFLSCAVQNSRATV